MPTLIEHLSHTAAVKEAEDAARSYFTSQPISARSHKEQGLFSRTLVVTLEDDTDVIVQLKDNEVDLTKVALARGLLGDIVPEMHRAKAKRVYFAYVAPIIRGTLWHLKTERKELSLEQEVRVASQIAHLISRCSLGIDSSGIVDSYVQPRLEKILEKEELTEDARLRIERLCGLTEHLKSLPLVLCHIDINSRNVILNKKARIVGLLDWEFACLLPFGMNAWCIRYLSMPCIAGKERLVERTQPMAESFWQTLTAGLSGDAQHKVVIAMQIGFVIISAFIEGLHPESLHYFVERFDWLESTFRPLCDSGALEN
ncbi:aminoglycoside phosphotransferase [Moniliophthora roreri MCA 2997]|uniref:Aminoglycoside phosphotransferase n=2 Tax=Moniliophthora roreri TaxID=221103 RepID=V2X6C4_MONRO|nr:aminoglycoside phosphotransferase [Moniliophthora roreri MCA 2997]KAI3597847.1 aminoglycoside phosphotransferase [Moniliophthora roreri]